MALTLRVDTPCTYLSARAASGLTSGLTFEQGRGEFAVPIPRQMQFQFANPGDAVTA